MPRKRLDMTPEERLEKEREYKRKSKAKRQAKDKEELAASPSCAPIPCPTAKALRTVEGVGALVHRVIRAVLAESIPADAKARVLAPWLNTLTDLVKADRYKKLQEALEAAQSGDMVKAEKVALDARN